MRHAKVNLREVEDQAARHGFGEVQEARFPRADLGLERTGLALLRIKPGRREAFAHRHRETEEVYVVLAGGGRVRLDDDVLSLEPLDAVRVPPGVTRRFEAGDQGLEVLVVGPRAEGDGEIVTGFWED